MTNSVNSPTITRHMVHRTVRHFNHVSALIGGTKVFITGPFATCARRSCTTILSIGLGNFFCVARLTVTRVRGRNDKRIIGVAADLISRTVSNIPSILTSLAGNKLGTTAGSLTVRCTGHKVQIGTISPNVVGAPVRNRRARTTLNTLRPIKRVKRIRSVARTVICLSDTGFIAKRVLRISNKRDTKR